MHQQIWFISKQVEKRFSIARETKRLFGGDFHKITELLFWEEWAVHSSRKYWYFFHRLGVRKQPGVAGFGDNWFWEYQRYNKKLPCR